VPAARGPQRRESRGGEDVDDVQVVGLERDRERQELEVAERPPRLERHHLAAALIAIEKKRPLAAHPRMAREDLEHRLEPEIRHPDGVGVGVDEADVEIAARRGGEEETLAVEARARTLANALARGSAVGRRHRGIIGRRFPPAQPMVRVQRACG
jgi:hypothetical protein